MISKILVGTSTILVVLLGLSAWYGKTMTESATKYRTENAQLVQSLSDEVAQNIELRNIAAKTESLLEGLREANNSLNAESRDWERKYTNVINSDEEAEEWADTPIPGTVLELLQDQPSEDGDSDPDATSTSINDRSDARVYRGYDRGLTNLYKRAQRMGHTLL